MIGLESNTINRNFPLTGYTHSFPINQKYIDTVGIDDKRKMLWSRFLGDSKN